MKVAAIPLITLVGLQAGYVLGGAIVIESIFNWPGIGNLALQAIQQRDFPMVQGTVLVIAVVFTVVNFLVDLDRKSTRLNSSHANISYAVFCLKKKQK